MKKIVLTAALFALASPAFAATAHKHAHHAKAATMEYVAIDSQTVVLGGDVLGRDPDPAVRVDLMRQGDAAAASGN